MIHELSGDILLSSAKAIAQGVAPNDDFHHGLALQLRERMPAMYKDFRHYCQTKHPKSGDLWTWMSSDGRYIVNLFTQDGAYDHGSKPGHATVSHVNHGVNGLDWNDVKPLIEKHLGDLGIPVYVYAHYQKNSKANEPAK
ncbi:MAG: hypothetical protein FD121_617 [Gallionellaceae bacterium]|nr:MAG: hypothetical protein FD121_617 [Gallionellaceae bacterium]